MGYEYLYAKSVEKRRELTIMLLEAKKELVITREQLLEAKREHLAESEDHNKTLKEFGKRLDDYLALLKEHNALKDQYVIMFRKQRKYVIGCPDCFARYDSNSFSRISPVVYSLKCSCGNTLTITYNLFGEKNG